jgi:hypothetical protein
MRPAFTAQDGTTDSHVCHILGACLALGYTPIAWRHIKPRHANYTEAKPYRLIGLFIISHLEKMVYRYIRDRVLRQLPLQQNQFA